MKNKKNKLIGVTIIGWILIGSSLCYLLSNSFSVYEEINRRSTWWDGNWTLLKDPHILFVIKGVLLVFLIVFISGIGILKLKNWARILYLGFLSLVSSWILFISVSSKDIIIPLITLLIVFLSFYYFNRTKVKEQFK